METLVLECASLEALVREQQTNLRHGRAFVPGRQPVTVFDEVFLRVVECVSGEQAEMRARVIMVSDSGPLEGVGLELTSDRNDIARELEALLARAAAGASGGMTDPPPPDEAAPTVAGADAQEPGPFLALDPSDATEGSPADELEAAADGHAAEAAALEAAALEAEELVAGGPESPETETADPDSTEHEGTEHGAEEAADAGPEDASHVPAGDAAPKARDAFLPDHRIPANVNERVRRLTLAEQMKLARTGELNERVAIERILGKAVWEALLSNPRVTPPEVARIARMGTAPRPIIEQITANPAWTQSSVVRRSLLTNPRLSEDGALKILRAMPKNELKLVEKTRAYTLVVRNAAKKLLRGSGG